MKDMINFLFQKYKNKGILVDTNILLLWIVGHVNRNRISKFNRTEQFLPEDYDLLVKLLNYFGQIITTPNILTEVNSLVNQLGEPERSQGLYVLGHLGSRLNELYLKSQEVVQLDRFTKFGLTDCGILKICPKQYLVLTDDLKLAHYLQTQEVDVLNFNHIRVYGW